MRSNFYPLLFCLSLCLILTSCSAYRSTGRKNFEAKASQNNVQVTSAKLEAIHSDQTDEALGSSDLCWEQSSHDPLWNIDEQSPMTIKKISEEEIQVCINSLHEQL